MRLGFSIGEDTIKKRNMFLISSNQFQLLNKKREKRERDWAVRIQKATSHRNKKINTSISKKLFSL